MNKTFPIAREGYPLIGYFFLLALFLSSTAVFFSSLVLTIPAALSSALFLFTVYFFRDPERTAPADPSVLVSPADGTVIVAETVENTPLGVPAFKISVFMSVFNVHVNRVPLSGTVERIDYDRGKFHDARHGRASFENERNSVVLATDGGRRVAFVQIAGLIARRIVCRLKPGERVTRSERYGLIRFGSRLDIYLPPEAEPLVTLGQITVAGETPIARMS